MVVTETAGTAAEVQVDTAVIEARGVTKDYIEGEVTVHVLTGIDLEVRKGEMLAIMGPSGSGKSTLLGVLSGLDTVTGGKVAINGKDITHLKESALASVRNREIGFIFQTFNLVDTLTAEENVELPVQLNPHSRVSAHKRANEILTQVGLEARRKHRPSQMSGGEQQRVAIARALANDPSVIFADEPTGNLDSTNGQAIMEILTELNRTMEKTLVIVTHDAAIAAQCHRTVYMRDGRLLHERRAVPSS